ncbi:MAG: hypothetical protein EBR55_09845 [Chitinophagia bacterium]|nr:hypothetical protein [Chitinophagia bacterium]
MAETKTVNLEVNSNLAKTEQAVTSLRSELRKAQADVAAMSDKFGVASKEAIEAAKRAAELKDRIGDAKNLTDAFNPDAKFKALAGAANVAAGALAGFEGAMGLVGVQSEDAQQAILKVQSALALSQGLNVLQEIPDTFKNIKAVGVDAFNSIKKAIGSTGIGLLVVALGTLYAYWDDIKEAVSGVSVEQKKLNVESKKNLTQEQEKLKAIGNQDEILKLQGKSEREILKMKIAQTDQTILAAKIDLQRIATTNEQQQKAVELNYKYLKSFIDFISIPQRYLFETAANAINKVIDLINKIPGVEIKARIDEKFAEKSADYITKLGFDPEKTRLEGEKTVKEAQLKLDELANQKAGFQNQINSIDKQAGEEAAKIAEDNAKSLEESRKRSREDDEAIRNEITQAISDAQEKQSEFLVSAQESEEQKVKDKYFRLIEYAKQFGIDTKELEIAQANELNDIKLAAQKKDYDNLKQAAEKEAALDLAIREAKRNALDTGLNILLQFAGKNKTIALSILAIQKGLAIADIVVGAAKSIASAQAALAATPAVIGVVPNPMYAVQAAATVKGIALTKITAATSIASILAASIGQAKSITGGDSGGGGSASSGSGGGSAAPSFNVVGNSGVNQLAQTMVGERQQSPIQAYVVAQNVTTAQGLNRAIINNASLG